MQIKRMLTAAMTVMTIGALAACGDSTNADTGRISLKLTDAPGDFQKAVVTIDQIYLQGGSDENPSGGRVVLLSTPVTTDLLTLANSVQDLVTDAVVPAGTYSQLREPVRPYRHAVAVGRKPHRNDGGGAAVHLGRHLEDDQHAQ